MKKINIALVLSFFLLISCTPEETLPIKQGIIPQPRPAVTKSIEEKLNPVTNSIPAPIPSKSQKNCHPSYSGCLNPSASDYDCQGGSGNGPYYTGEVRVIGYDEFGLDRDGDGWGCE